MTGSSSTLLQIQGRSWYQERKPKIKSKPEAFSLKTGQKILPGIAELSLLISALACGRGLEGGEKGGFSSDQAVEKAGFMFNHWMLEHGAIMAIYVWNMWICSNCLMTCSSKQMMGDGVSLDKFGLCLPVWLFVYRFKDHKNLAVSCTYVFLPLTLGRQPMLSDAVDFYDQKV